MAGDKRQIQNGLSVIPVLRFELARGTPNQNVSHQKCWILWISAYHGSSMLPQPNDRTTSPDAARYVMTGATGMVGAYVLALSMRRGDAVLVLGRPKTVGSGERAITVSLADRIDQILRPFESAWQTPLPRPESIESDLNKVDLGLSGTAVESMDRFFAGGPRCWLHSAASLNFSPAVDHPMGEPIRTNVGGTQHLLALADRVGADAFHHVSTAYVCGLRSGRVVEHEGDVGQSHANDYERSKLAAEQRVRDQFGDRAAIYRPSIVIDPEGLTPVSGDRTIYGAYSMFQSLAAKFGLPEDQSWMRSLGFAGDERKNLVDAGWVARVIVAAVRRNDVAGATYHLTSPVGTSIRTLDDAFTAATRQWLNRRRDRTGATSSRGPDRNANDGAAIQSQIDQMSAGFVETFLPYFRDDPVFDRTGIDGLITAAGVPSPPTIGREALSRVIENWSAPKVSVKPPKKSAEEPAAVDVGDNVELESNAVAESNIDVESSAAVEDHAEVGSDDDLVICGYAVRLPGGVDGVDQFASLLFGGRSAIEAMPPDRLDRDLYFDSRKGVPGKTYSDRGGWVDPTPIDDALHRRIESLGTFDLTHRQFAAVAVAAIDAAAGSSSAESSSAESSSTGASAASHRGRPDASLLDANRGGIFVGHSGGTQFGGPLAMSIQAAAAAETIADIDARLSPLTDELADRIRDARPAPRPGGGPHYDAYRAASLAAELIGLRGRREVIDAACSSSLVALSHAKLAIDAGRLDYAVVGGATFNNVDNLALFSQSRACSDGGCHPFDARAAGLISSEGYVAVVVARRSVAVAAGMPVLAVVHGIGVASDGKGKGLWAPRTEGQQLAIRRGSRQDQFQVDYMECHATSTQVGDATELESLTAVIGSGADSGRSASPLLIGSAKSNLGHLLEAAGLVGLVKCLIAMEAGQIPPSIGFEKPNERFDWSAGAVKVVRETTEWPKPAASDDGAPGDPPPDDRPFTAGVNAFGIGGLNAHARIQAAELMPVTRRRRGVVSSTRSLPTQSSRTQSSRTQLSRTQLPKIIPKPFDPIAIVAADVVLPGAADLDGFESLLRLDQTALSDPPPGRWPTDGQGRLIGVGDRPGEIPSAMAGYIEGFEFDAQSYRIPPKMVRYANPAQLMLIDAVRRAMGRIGRDRLSGRDAPFGMNRQAGRDGSLGDGGIDRRRVGVAVGTIFGGQFSNELQVGLRIPEIQRHLDDILSDRGVLAGDRDKIRGRLRELLLDRYSALLDETGGFTASTLASSIARTFDLMGGAYAVDADQASGLLAVLSSIERLHAGEIDLGIVGAVHRSNDLVCMQQLFRRGQLANGADDSTIGSGQKVLPGEGVATILLMRHTDAVATGRPILGVITAVDETLHDNVTDARRGVAGSDDTPFAQRPRSSGPRIAHTIGHVGGAHAIVQMIATTFDFHNDDSDNQRDTHHELTTNIDAIADDGFGIHLQMQKTLSAANPSRPVDLTLQLDGLREHRSNQSSAVANGSGSSSNSGRAAMLLAANDSTAIRDQLERLSRGEAVDRAGDPTDQDAFAHDRFAVAIAAPSDGVASVAASLIRQIDIATAKQTPITQSVAGGWIVDGHDVAGRGRVGWLLPGQGSQYAARPSILDTDPVAQSSLSRFDQALIRGGLSPIGDRMDDPTGDLGRDVWWTQIWVLGAGVAMVDAMLARGHRPDVVLGHSFGECTAAYAAGVMDVAEAIRFARVRSEAVCTAATSDQTLLSIRCNPMTAAAVLRGEVAYEVTHHNAPEQTVIAVDRSDLAAAKSVLQSRKIAAAPIDVPAAFHTAAMAGAESLLRSRFAGTPALPPRFAFLSAISGRYLSEPAEVIENLIGQLTAPVHFAAAVDRMVDDSCGLLIEVGPSSVLTRLAAAGVGGRALCLAADTRGVDHDHGAALIDAAMRRWAGGNQTTVRGTASGRDEPTPASIDSPPSKLASPPVASQSPVVSTPPSNGQPDDPFDFVDVTRRGRREQPTGGPGVAASSGSGGTATLQRPPRSIGSDAEPAGLAVEDLAVQQSAAEDVESLSASLQRMIIDLVVDQTGYDEDIIDMEADLEAELGVDSIKRAQLLGELETQYDLQSLRDQNLTLADFQTLGSIHAYVLDYLVKKKS